MVATQEEDYKNDTESETQRLVERVQQVMSDRRKETEGQGFGGPRAPRPFSAEWIRQHIGQSPPKNGSTRTTTSLDAKESYLPKEVNIHDILADMWSKDRRTQIQKSMHNILEDYEPRPEKPFRSANSPLSNHHLEERSFAAKYSPRSPSTFVLSPNSSYKYVKNKNNNNMMRTSANLKQGLAKAIASGAPSAVVVKKKKLKGNSNSNSNSNCKPRRSSLRVNGQLQSIYEEILGPSDDYDLDEPDLLESEPEIHGSCSPEPSPRAEYENETAATRESSSSSSSSNDDESPNRSISISDHAACLPASEATMAPAPPPSFSPLHNKQRWEAVPPEMVNDLMLNRSLSDEFIPEDDDDEDSHILDSPDLVSLEWSDSDSFGTLPEKEPLPLPLQDEHPESSSVPLESSDTIQFRIVSDPTGMSRFKGDQQPVVSRRRLSVEYTSISPSSVASLSPVDSSGEEGYLPLNDKEPTLIHKRKKQSGDKQRNSPSSMPPLSPYSSSGDEPRSSGGEPRSSSSEPREKPEKKKKKSSKTKKKNRIASPKSSKASVTFIVPKLTETTKEKKPKSVASLSSSDSVPKVVDKKEKKPRQASNTGAVPESSTSGKKSEKKEKKPRAASIAEPRSTTTENNSSEKKEKKPRRGIFSFFTPAPAHEKSTAKKEKKRHRASTETVTVPPEKPPKTALRTVAAPEPTSVKSVGKKGKKPRIASIQTNSSTVSDATADMTSEEMENKPRRSALKSLTNTQVVESSEKKGKSTKSKKGKTRSSKSSDPSVKKEKSPEEKAMKKKKKKVRSKSCGPSEKTETKKKARSKSCGPSEKTEKKKRSKSKTPKSPKKSKKTKKKSSKSKSSDEQLSMSMPDLFTTSSETDFEPSINLNASTGALSHDATIEPSSNTNDPVNVINSTLSKLDSEQDSSVNEIFETTTSLVSSRAEDGATVKSHPVVSQSELNILVGPLESTPIARDEKTDASAPIKESNCESQSSLFISAQMSVAQETVEQQPESSERDKAVERTGSIELCSSKSEELELSRQDEGVDSANELFYSAQSLLSANGEESDIQVQHNVAEEGSQDFASCASIENKEARDTYAGIDMKGVQFLLGHLQVILCLDALMKYPSEEETSSSDVLPPIEAKIRARWGLINALGKTEEAKQARDAFVLQYGLLSTDVDELISHLRLCERTGADVRWDLVYQMVFPQSEIRWGVFDQILQSVTYPTAHPDLESVEWSGDSLLPSEDGFTPTTGVPVKEESLAALFSPAAIDPLARIEDEMEVSGASSNSWSYANALLNDTQVQLAFRMEYDVTDEEFAAMLRYLSHCKATNTKIEWDKMEQVLCDTPLGVDMDSGVEDGSDSGSDHTSYCSMNDWTAESVAGESYFSVYPEHDDCASELTFGYDDRRLYMEDEMSISSFSIYTNISEALTEGPKEHAADNTNQNPLQLPDLTTGALGMTRSSSFNRHGREGLGGTSTLNRSSRRGPGRTSSFNDPRRGLGPNSSFRGPRRGKGCMLFNRTHLESIQDSGLTAPSTVGSCSVGQSGRATAGSSSVDTREHPRFLRRYHSASAALENLAEALVRQHAVF